MQMLAAVLLILAAIPGFDEAFRSGLLALHRGDLKGAESGLAQAAKLAPSDGRVWVALAQVRRRLGDEAGAESAASLAAKNAAGNKPILAALGAYYFEAAKPLLQTEHFAEAAKLLDTARRRVPGDAQLELALGVACYGLRRFDDAAAAFLRTIDIDPAIEQPYVFLGRFPDQVASRLPEITRKFAAYEKANPGNYLGYFLHAKALNAGSGDTAMSLKLLEKALSLNSKDAATQFELGTVLDQLRRYDDAAKAYEAAAAMDPSDAPTQYRLARVLSRLGREADAQRARAAHEKLTSTQDAKR